VSLLLFIYGDYAHYFLSGRSALCENNAVNNYLLDLAVKYAKEKNCLFFNYGGGNSPEKSDALFRFKRNFSKETRMFYISRLIHNEKVYNHVCDLWEQANKLDKSINSNRLLKYHE